MIYFLYKTAKQSKTKLLSFLSLNSEATERYFIARNPYNRSEDKVWLLNLVDSTPQTFIINGSSNRAMEFSSPSMGSISLCAMENPVGGGNSVSLFGYLDL